MDNDAPGHDAMDKFARKLGMARCFLVKPIKEDLDRLHAQGKVLKDANDALRLGVDMNAMIKKSKPLEHQQITSFRSMRQQVLHELRHSEEYKGTMIKSLPQFSGIVKGLRKGEVSLVTGATGSGKTTLLSQISLDCAQQVRKVMHIFSPSCCFSCFGAAFSFMFPKKSRMLV
jgi:twinkle protein